MSTHNVCLHREIRKNLPDTPFRAMKENMYLDTLLIWRYELVLIYVKIREDDITSNICFHINIRK